VVTLAGERDTLGLWAGSGGVGAKLWMSVLTDLRNRGVKDVLFVVCAGLKGLPAVVGNVWPQEIVQACIIDLVSTTFRLTSPKYWDEIKRDTHQPSCSARHAISVSDSRRCVVSKTADSASMRDATPTLGCDMLPDIDPRFARTSDGQNLIAGRRNHTALLSNGNRIVNGRSNIDNRKGECYCS
jgi:hypothetical protein